MSRHEFCIFQFYTLQNQITMIKNIAIILAGGSGSRLGYEKPKQFLKVAGKLIIEHTVEVFQKHKNINEIAIVCHKDYISLVENIVNNNGLNKVKKILIGGNSRRDSALIALQAYNDLDVNLIFHDAVRPLVSENIITKCVNGLKKHNAVDVAIVATDTIIKVKDNLIESIPGRNELRIGQTPQAFRLSTIKKAHELGLKDPNFKATDDCGVVRKYLPAENIYVVDGEQLNMKLTYEEDLHLLDKLFQIRSKQLSESLQDISLLKNKVLVLFGGSSGIGSDIVKTAKTYGARIYSFSRTETDTDISITDNIHSALKQTYNKEGIIDYVVNTAGVLNKEPLINMDYPTIQQAITINYFGCINIAKESFEYLRESKGGLLFFTSSSYTRGRANYSIYSSSKAAVVNLTQALSDEWDYYNIRVNCINPERTKTPMRVKKFGIEEESVLLRSEEVAKASIQTLLLPISGQIIDIKIKEKHA